MKSIRLKTSTYLIATFFAAMSSSVVAAPPYGNAVQLQNIESTTSINIHGSCGNAYINITGVDRDYPTLEGGLDGNLKSVALGTSGSYAGSYAEVTVMTGSSDRQKTTRILLEEASMVKCIATKSGKMVVIGTECRGNVDECYNPNYFVIDAEKITNVDTKKFCDAKCANRKLGGMYIKIRE